MSVLQLTTIHWPTTACAPGILVALPCAFVLRRFQLVADNERAGSVELSGSVYEIALVILSAYMAYLVAEARPLRCSPSSAASRAALASLLQLVDTETFVRRVQKHVSLRQADEHTGSCQTADLR